MKLTALGSLALLGLLACGCASREQAGAEATPTPGSMDLAYATPVPDNQSSVPAPPDDAPMPTPTATLPPPPPEEAQAGATETPIPSYSRRSYVVHKDDTLWGISAKADILGDPFRWPLLFKANRDLLKDPDIISPGESLTWKANYTRFEVEDAIQKSKDTPAYVPHQTERKELPVEY